MSRIPARTTRINGRWTILLPDHRNAWYRDNVMWEAERLAALHDTIRPGDTVFDIGAEQGDMTGLFAQWVGEAGRIVIAEPAGHYWPNIRATFEANQLPDPAVCWHGFIGAHTDYDPPRNDIGEPLSSAANVDPWPKASHGPISTQGGFRHLAQQTDSTPTITLDDLCDAAILIPDVITIDVEGSEERVLRGGERTLKAFHPVVFVSVHPPILAEWYDSTPEAIDEYMASVGYAGELIYDDGHELHVRYAVTV